MEIQFTPDQQARLARMASDQGRAAEELVSEAVNRLFRYDEWFQQEIDRGLAEANNDEFVEHAEIKRLVENRYRGK